VLEYARSPGGLGKAVAGEAVRPERYELARLDVAYKARSQQVQGAGLGGEDPVVADAAERERLWKEITALHPRYAAYQRRTSREIPVVLLRPDGS
jgi:hypothetical protein